MHIALPKSRGGVAGPPDEQLLGFLAAGRHPELGYLGGLLLTTTRGRPLEFYCTTPVQPSAAQRILYGPELEPYIYAGLIAAGLMGQSSPEPFFVVTDQLLVLGVRPEARCPVLYVPPRSDDSPGQQTAGVAPEVQTHPDFPGDRDALMRWIDQEDSGVDLCEPFGRIWEALEVVLNDEEKQAA